MVKLGIEDEADRHLFDDTGQASDVIVVRMAEDHGIESLNSPQGEGREDHPLGNGLRAGFLARATAAITWMESSWTSAAIRRRWPALAISAARAAACCSIPRCSSARAWKSCEN